MSAVLAAWVGLTACGGGTEQQSSPEETASETAVTAAPVEEGEILNFIPPEKGEKIAVITVRDYGEIKIKLFPEAAQAGVENFVGLAEMNYYDELIFHRIIPEFMIQGGDPRGDGTGGSSIWGEKFDGGIPEGLYHFSGAVAYANSTGPATDGSQFYIVNTPEGYFNLGGYRNEDGSVHYYETFEEAGYSLPVNVQEMYREKGGTPSLDGGYTVFGQVFEGLDIVRSIAQVETDDNDKPLTQVVMDSVRIVEYEG
ncbi:MAG: peptidylprolyl isomerase [Ruminococcus sp.]|nr:peptidylprolyl isomerase [Ruminococcus sp.]